MARKKFGKPNTRTDEQRVEAFLVWVKEHAGVGGVLPQPHEMRKLIERHGLGGVVTDSAVYRALREWSEEARKPSTRLKALIRRVAFRE